MNKSISHRGPDNQGTYTRKNIGFGHTRLAIIDLSEKGNQPLHYTHNKKKYSITFNGEIYNFKEIKKELEAKGYLFKTKTDTEVLLAAYVHWGENCLEKCNGMFSFVIYDHTKHILFGARDRLGLKPLKFYIDKQRFICSSELKSILTQNVSREIDLQAIDLFLTLQYVPAPKTGFKHIQKLPNAHKFTLDITEKKLTIKKYWDINYTTKKKSKSEWITQIQKKLDQSIQRRLLADVPVGAFLSGGVDSSAVVAYMSKHVKQVKTFSIGFTEKKYDESAYARKVASLFNTEHHELLVKPTDFLPLIDTLVQQYEEPYADVSQLPTFALAKFARKHVKVTLNGDGGDENFAGYDKYEKHLLAEKVFIPGAALIANILNYIPRKTTFMQKLISFLFTVNKPAWRRQYNYTTYFDELSKKQLYKKQIKTINPFKEQTKGLQGINDILYIDFHTYVPDNLLVKVDIATMANGLESRSPLLDYEFVEVMAQIPIEQKIKGKQRKIIFKEALKNELPKDILYRKKQGFGIPIDDWIRNELKEEVLQTILDEQGLVLQLMKKKRIQQLLKYHFQGINNGKKIWALFMLNKWYTKVVHK